jgi:hypothetical protein
MFNNGTEYDGKNIINKYIHIYLYMRLSVSQGVKKRGKIGWDGKSQT